ncbi:MAG: ABC transporter ATP-binding protein [Thermosphaera sp.]
MHPAISARIEQAGYPGGFAIRDIEFDLYPGELMVVMGESGSGKTTLLRAITGTIKLAGGFLEGTVLINGISIDEISPDEFYLKVGYIPQEPWYGIIGYTVETEYCHSLAVSGFLCEFFDLMKLGLGKKLKHPTYGLSAGETQRLLWSEALARGVYIFILDEPLVYIDIHAREMLYSVVESSLRDNKTVIVVDHNPLFWKEIASKMIILNEGRTIYTGEWREDLLSPVRFVEHVHRVSNEVAISLENIWFRYPGGDYIFKNYSLNLKKGIITGLVGGNGSGKSTLLKICSGLLKPNKGRVLYKGRRIYIPENPLLYFSKPTPWEELIYASGGDESKVLEVAERFNLKRVLQSPLAKLSSGERRRLALASALLANYQIYLIDEPSAGLDDASAKALLEVLNELVDDGLTIIVSTHDERVSRFLDEIVEVGVQ